MARSLRSRGTVSCAERRRAMTDFERKELELRRRCDEMRQRLAELARGVDRVADMYTRPGCQHLMPVEEALAVMDELQATARRFEEALPRLLRIAPSTLASITGNSLGRLLASAFCLRCRQTTGRRPQTSEAEPTPASDGATGLPSGGHQERQSTPG